MLSDPGRDLYREVRRKPRAASWWRRCWRWCGRRRLALGVGRLPAAGCVTVSWNQVRCWTLTCDNCADGWTDAAGQPHFDSCADAKAHALAAGWVVTATRALCPECIESEMCALAGHRWGRWTRLDPFPSPSSGCCRVRYCTLCTIGQWDPPIRKFPDKLSEAG
jgi:hypothetical protein